MLTNEPITMAKTPDFMKIPRLKFIIKLQKANVNKHEVAKELMKIMENNKMARTIKEICTEFKWKLNTKLIKKFEKENKEEIHEIENKKIDEDSYETNWKLKLDFLMKIGEREEARNLALKTLDEENLSNNNRFDAMFSLFRIAYFDDCNVKLMVEAIKKIKSFIDKNESRADWSSRNKLKAYEGLCALACRDYKTAAIQLSDCISTFESYELADFTTIIKYTVIACMIVLPRSEIKKKIVNNGVVMQELISQCENGYKEYVTSLDECRYSDFFKVLPIIEIDLRLNPLISLHHQQYIKNMRLKAFAQMLQSYSTVSLKCVANTFGTSEEFIENELSRFAASGELMCRIDKVAGQILTEHGGAVVERAVLYQDSIKKGDMLLNRIKRLARIIET